MRQPRRRVTTMRSGSIIVVVATDAPLLPHQLKRIATRVALGVGRAGGFGGNGSGDIFIAFSTANPRAASAADTVSVRMIANARMSPLFGATAQATEEAIVNAMLAAETMTGANDLRVYALPVDRLKTDHEEVRSVAGRESGIGNRESGIDGHTAELPLPVGAVRRLTERG